MWIVACSLWIDSARFEESDRFKVGRVEAPDCVPNVLERGGIVVIVELCSIGRGPGAHAVEDDEDGSLHGWRVWTARSKLRAFNCGSLLPLNAEPRLHRDLRQARLGPKREASFAHSK